MFSVLKKLNPLQRRFVRILYVVVIVALATFALVTWQQLKALRSAPVALPNYLFYVVEKPGANLIQAQGTWMVTSGPAQRDSLQTSTIECQQARMLCIESNAVVSVFYGSVLESTPRVYEIDSWIEGTITTKPVTSMCSAQTLTLNVAERTVTAATTLSRGASECKDAPRTLQLEDGKKAKAAATGEKKS